MALLFITRSRPRSQHRPCAQAKRNRAGREMTHPLLENASSPGSLPQQPSERNWAPKPPAGLAFSQQTRGPLLCPQVPQRSGPPAPPTGSCLSRPKKICVRRRGGLPLPQDLPTPLETPSLRPTPYPAPREAPEPFYGGFSSKGLHWGEMGERPSQDTTEGRPGFFRGPFTNHSAGPGAPAWGAAFSTGKQWLWREDSTACLTPGGVRVWPSPPFRHG